VVISCLQLLGESDNGGNTIIMGNNVSHEGFFLFEGGLKKKIN